MTESVHSLTPLRHRVLLYAFGILVLAFLFLPTLIVIPMSFSDSRYLQFPPPGFSLRWYQHFINSPEWRSATFVSLQGAILTALTATLLGTTASYALNRLRPRWLAGVTRTVLFLPILVPVILIAIGLYYVFARIGLNNTLLGLVIAHTLLALPIVVIIVSAGLQSFDMQQEQVACSLGATRLKAFITVTLPQIRASILSAAIFSFITSLDEVVVALFITGGPTSTIQRRLFSALRDEIDPTIAVVSTCLTALSVGLVLLGRWLVRNRNEPKL